MAQSGRPPKPTEQKRRLGNPGRRQLPDTAPVAPMETRTPSGLGPAGEALWEAVTAAAAPWLAPTDNFVLLLLCELYDRRALFQAALDEHGPLITRPADGHIVANPAAQLLIQTEKQISELASKLGFTPADRTRIGLGEVKAKNAFEEMMSQF